MKKDRPMSILLIEDDEYEVSNFEKHMNCREDAKLVKFTNSSYEGLEYVKKYQPEGIIVDLELHNGEGSGLNYLEEIQKLKLDFKPVIVVTTNVSSDTMYDHIHKLKVDFIFYKKQTGYGPEMVINSMVTLRENLYRDKSNITINKTTTETPIEKEERIKEKINSELDLIGISNHLKGRKYLFDAIFYLLDNEDEQNSVFNYISNKYKIVNSSISRAMQTAINYAWRISSIDDLMVHYTARINHETGVPSPTEFIYYYAENIRKFL